MIINVNKEIVERFFNCICFKPVDYYVDDSCLHLQIEKLANKLLDQEIEKHEKELENN
tara:strand:+ start:3344 stop:3517 length:174 start_codon:yes stop_codon:yes gene_type:complete